MENVKISKKDTSVNNNDQKVEKVEKVKCLSEPNDSPLLMVQSN